MRCPTLRELPAPPEGKTGWPWTVESPPLSDFQPDGKSWPTISIVTPSFNQGQFIEETIRSILLQGYPHIEYIVMDGLSTDNTLQVLDKYRNWIHHIESKEDSGQADAINKGWRKSTGEIFQWINSDDCLLPGALEKVGIGLANFDVLASSIETLKTDGSREVELNSSLCIESILKDKFQFRQPGLWMTKKQSYSCFPLETQLHYGFDWLMLVKLANACPRINYMGVPTVVFRHHAASKTIAHPEKWDEEGLIIFDIFLRDPTYKNVWPLFRSRRRLLGLRRKINHRPANFAELISALRTAVWLAIVDPTNFPFRFFAGYLLRTTGLKSDRW